jgi:hypothetical protein
MPLAYFNWSNRIQALTSQASDVLGCSTTTLPNRPRASFTSRALNSAIAPTSFGSGCFGASCSAAFISDCTSDLSTRCFKTVAASRRIAALASSLKRGGVVSGRINRIPPPSLFR